MTSGGGSLPLKGEYPSLPVVLYLSEGVDELACEFCLLRSDGELSGDDLPETKPFPFNCLSLVCLFTGGDPFVLNTGLVFGVECVSNGMTSSERSTWHCTCLISVLMSSRLEVVELETLSMFPFCWSTFGLLPLK